MDNWIIDTHLWHCRQNKQLVEKHNEWEKKKLQDGYKPVYIPHPEYKKTFLIKFVK